MHPILVKYVSAHSGVPGVPMNGPCGVGWNTPPLFTPSSADHITTSPADYIGKWYHVASVFDGKVMSLYINGVLISNMGVVIPFNGQTDRRIEIGRWPGSWYDARIYNVALTEADIKAIMKERA